MLQLDGAVQLAARGAAPFRLRLSPHYHPETNKQTELSVPRVHTATQLILTAMSIMTTILCGSFYSRRAMLPSTPDVSEFGCFSLQVFDVKAAFL